MSPPPTLPPRPAYRRRRFATARAVMALMLREMSTSFGRSPGGYLWAILEP
ncbi:MAG: sugar ABC transporter permease, partial [Paracoccaceae bacterium]|nr:sugar ABC transporter permease [Paracoccaceae bacterium]